ncbi:hypothetical protein LK08_08550 [Streptomyces sp. MUSC 125]|uniref:transposase n=1 Tax=Streptomyces TaxID=1883 RepID=UPI000574C885|nr:MULTISPECIES: transposase [Streptomyces]KIE27410.1 hypothetical protein LK08_08550 [Streptomyces sp. MUSC 125]
MSAALNPLERHDDHHIRFGNDPTSSAFGGRTFGTGDGRSIGHAPSGCWGAGPSPNNLTNIVLGQADKALTIVQLPAYAPDLNPAEDVWSLVKRDIGNLAAGLSHVTRAARTAEHRARLEQVRLAWPREVVETAPGTYEWNPSRKR